MFACELFDVVPDLIATAKGIAGGLPLAAVTGRAEIMNAAHVGGLGGTYGGNPVACAAALAAMETIKAENLIARAAEIERIMLGRLHRIQAEDNRVGDVRGRGAMIAVELVHQDSTDPDPGFTTAVATAAREKGVIVLTCGTYGNVLRFLPPLTISDELLNEGLDLLAEVFAAT
jgi:4-aminobutyrate aminotransferase/(S)-3-amino-2-methylpropionate transaminase